MAGPAMDDAFGAVAQFFSMLADPTRLRIMHAICEHERTVNEIVAATGVGQTNVSRHLGLMHRHGVVTRRRDGARAYYRVADEMMPALCRAVCTRLARTVDESRPLRGRLLKLMPASRRHAV